MGLGSTFIELGGPQASHKELFFFFIGTNVEASQLLACLTNWAFLSPPELNVPHEQETIATASSSSCCTPGVCGVGLTFIGL